MQYFLCELVPPRPSFAQDMTEAERAVMGEHVAYWTEMAEQGVAIVFGPVADPKGAWGLGVLEVDDEEHLLRLTENDPAIRGGIGCRYEILPMLRAVVGKRK